LNFNHFGDPAPPPLLAPLKLNFNFSFWGGGAIGPVDVGLPEVEGGVAATLCFGFFVLSTIR